MHMKTKNLDIDSSQTIGLSPETGGLQRQKQIMMKQSPLAGGYEKSENQKRMAHPVQCGQFSDFP